ncbi:MAG: PD-(D/E)XK nuclease family protein [Bacteroidales bacterium]|nr:PD-(D/E)XK nuclease family protein [Bacteroidales bacterium]
METTTAFKPFLRNVADDLIGQFGNNLSSLCVVFPNKRARLFFSQYLGEACGGQTIWAPAYRTISELVQELSGLILADKIQLIFEFFSVYKRITGTAEDFDDFYHYSEMLLTDFEEVDKSLVNAHDLFSNLADQKSIESGFDYLSENQLNAIKQFWGTFDGGRVSRDQKEFMNFWGKLYDVYNAFRQQLKSESIAYEGMIYREVASMIRDHDNLTYSFDRYIMVGFNALNACEKILFDHLKKTGKAIFYWDFDDYYTAHEWHEAGFFMRDNTKRYPGRDAAMNNSALKAIPKNITVLPVSSATAQAKVIPAVFKMIGLSEQSDLRHTALVLPDEKLMLPVLHSLPPYVNDINVTMGYPLKESAAFSFLELVYHLHKNARDQNGDLKTFYYKDVIALLKHPFIYSCYKETTDKLISSIRNNNSVFPALKDLQANDELQFLFQPLRSAADTISYLLNILEFTIRNILNADDLEINRLQLECTFQAYQSIKRLSEILLVSELAFSSQLLFRFVRKILRGITVPFSGEPLAGLQVLGLLETRLLDFENVILLSMNEGIMPRSFQFSSFIPANLRFGFGMPVPEHYDAVYAYYFYRLIQRAKNVFLIYNEHADGMVTGERSRYIHQLACEPVFGVKEIRLETVFPDNPVKEIAINKTAKIYSKIDRYFEGNSGAWLSPGAVNEYISCPLKFYFHRILSLKEAEEVAEDVDPLIFGNILHVSMNELYNPFVGKDVKKEDLTGMIKQTDRIEDIIIKAFQKIIYKNASDQTRELTGMHMIIKEIIKKYIVQILNSDLKNCPFYIVSLEKEYRSIIHCNSQGRICNIQIGGIIDRIDRYNGKTRIIDYKTGTGKLFFDGIESLFTSRPSKRNEAALQVFLYSYLYQCKFHENPVVPCLVYVRESHSHDFSWMLKDRSDRSEELSFTKYFNLFEELLKSTLENLIDPSVPFIQTDDEDYCRYCAYRDICHR